ncbi:hypothetical protein [Neptuniibacter sp. QD57_21]|uniref:hypothetical protein n=1 Tax=Neptuniibacter sp. QD57_21 TaxID=3398213 RepID=UPI0039F59552
MLKKVAFLFIVVLMLVLAVNPSYRWLLVNGVPAYQCASNGVATENCQWFVDFVVVGEEEGTIFHEPNSSFMYGYSKTGNLVSKHGYEWKQIIGPWYVLRFET